MESHWRFTGIRSARISMPSLSHLADISFVFKHLPKKLRISCLLSNTYRNRRMMVLCFQTLVAPPRRGGCHRLLWHLGIAANHRARHPRCPAHSPIPPMSTPFSNTYVGKSP
jgi:hypothetical protein